jgi:hypothetical protein
MKKSARDTTRSEGAKSAVNERTLMLADVIQENLFAFVVREGMKALDVLLEREREPRLALRTFALDLSTCGDVR